MKRRVSTLVKYIFCTHLLFNKLINLQLVIVCFTLLCFQLVPLYFNSNLLAATLNYYSEKKQVNLYKTPINLFPSKLNYILNLLYRKFVNNFKFRLIENTILSYECDKDLKNIAVNKYLCTNCESTVKFINCKTCKQNLENAFIGYKGQISVIDVKGFDNYLHANLFFPFTIGDFFYKLVYPIGLLVHLFIKKCIELNKQEGYEPYLNQYISYTRWSRLITLICLLGVVWLYTTLLYMGMNIILRNRYANYSIESMQYYDFRNVLCTYPSVSFILLLSTILNYIELIDKQDIFKNKIQLKRINNYIPYIKLGLLFTSYHFLIRDRQYYTYIFYNTIVPYRVVDYNAYTSFKYQQELLKRTSAKIVVLKYSRVYEYYLLRVINQHL